MRDDLGYFLVEVRSRSGKKVQISKLILLHKKGTYFDVPHHGESNRSHNVFNFATDTPEPDYDTLTKFCDTIRKLRPERFLGDLSPDELIRFRDIQVVATNGLITSCTATFKGLGHLL